MTGTCTEEMQMQKWVGGYMCHHSTFPELKSYIALDGENLTTI